MNDYKSRIKQEYLELITRISKLRRMIVLAKADKLEFKLSCKDELLEEQLEAMEKCALVQKIKALHFDRVLYS
jgi:hypothetical protein